MGLSSRRKTDYGFAAYLLSAGALRRLLTNSPGPRLTRAVTRLLELQWIDEDASLASNLDRIYYRLQVDYPTELIIRVKLLESRFFARSTFATANVIPQLHVGDSIADVVIVNSNSASIYEIKSDFDSSSKLQKQLADYQQISSSTWVVTTPKQAKKYQDLLGGTAVGLLLVGNDRIIVEKKGLPDTSRLSISRMFSVLRKAEYTQILEKSLGRRVTAPQTEHYAHCLNLALQMQPQEFYRAFWRMLRKRRRENCDKLFQITSPPVRDALLHMSLSDSQIERFHFILERPLRECITLS